MLFGRGDPSVLEINLKRKAFLSNLASVKITSVGIAVLQAVLHLSIVCRMLATHYVVMCLKKKISVLPGVRGAGESLISCPAYSS